MDAHNNTFRVATQAVGHTFCEVNAFPGLLHNSCMAADPIAVESGARLKRCREAVEWTQRQLAIQTGWTDRKPDRAQRFALSPSRIGNFEQGARRIGVEEARILQRVFDIPAPYFMGEIDEKEAGVIAALRGLKSPPPLDRTG